MNFTERQVQNSTLDSATEGVVAPLEKTPSPALPPVSCQIHEIENTRTLVSKFKVSAVLPGGPGSLLDMAFDFQFSSKENDELEINYYCNKLDT